MSPRGTLVARYEVSASDQRALAILRAICAVLALAGSVAMMLGKLPVPLFMVAVLAVLLSVAWLAQARRLGRAARNQKRPALNAYSDGLLIEEAARNDWLPWSDIAAIAVDEERLEIVVTRHDGQALRIEPRYQGVDLYELVHTLNRVWRQAASPSAQADPDQQLGAPGWRSSRNAR